MLFHFGLIAVTHFILPKVAGRTELLLLTYVLKRSHIGQMLIGDSTHPEVTGEGLCPFPAKIYQKAYICSSLEARSQFPWIADVLQICHKWHECREQLVIMGLLCSGISISCFWGSLRCAQGQTLPPLLYAEWSNGLADQICWLRLATSMLAVGSWKRLQHWLGCKPADPELQLCSENSDLVWMSPSHAALSALCKCAHCSETYSGEF